MNNKNSTIKRIKFGAFVLLVFCLVMNMEAREDMYPYINNTYQNCINCTLERGHSIPQDIFNASTKAVLLIEAGDVDFGDNHLYINDYFLGNLKEGDDIWETTEIEFDPTFLKAGTNIVRIKIGLVDWVEIRKSELQVYYNVFSISGTTTAGSTPIPEVTITFSFDGSTKTTDNNGNYSRDVYPNTTTTITPFKSGYNWDPPNRTVGPVTTDLSNLNFKGNMIPSVTTLQVSNIAQTTATGGGNVINDGYSEVTARGVCWKTSPSPTIYDPHTLNGTGTGEFTSSITGLTPATTYYVRAYATNSVGTAYGNEVSFSTLATPPTLTTTPVTFINSTSVSSGGTITDDCGVIITARGVCWSTLPNPTTSGNHTTDGTGTGEFASQVTGLTPGTFYYLRAYATNSGGTGYGNHVTFTIPPNLPTVTTTAVSAVTTTSAASGGNVTNDGGSAVTAKGICWSTSPSPNISDTHTIDGAGIGSFTSTMSGLNPGTKYFVRAYATNASAQSTAIR